MGHARPPVCRSDTRPLFGSASSKAARSAGCSEGSTSCGRAESFRAQTLVAEELARSLVLDDAEIDLLLSAVTTEAQRRGRLPKRQPQSEPKLAGRRTAVDEISHGLTKGKLNAVRAAFKARVKPSAIARQFGISQSDVRNALAQGTRSRHLRRTGPSSGYCSSIIMLAHGGASKAAMRSVATNRRHEYSL